MPRWVDAKRATFKYGLGNRSSVSSGALHQLGLDRTTPVRVRSANGPSTWRRAMWSQPGYPLSERPSDRG
jgi:hypothetical protein